MRFRDPTPQAAGPARRGASHPGKGTRSPVFVRDMLPAENAGT